MEGAIVCGLCLLCVAIVNTWAFRRINRKIVDAAIKEIRQASNESKEKESAK